MYSGRIVVDFSCVAIGVETDDGQVYDQAGVHIGSATEDGMVVDFAGIRIGTVRGARPQPAGAGV